VAAYVFRRLGWASVLVVVVTVNAYMLFYVVPTEDVALGASFANVTEDTGVNRFDVNGSVITGYVRFLGRLVHADLGQSWRTREDVSDILARSAPATLSLLLGGALVWTGLALAIGVVSAMRPRSFLDRAGMMFVLVGLAAQPLWLGYVLAYLFGYRLGWTPITGYCDFFNPSEASECGGPAQWAYHMILPWATFAILFAALYVRLIRANVLETMNEDYVRTARAKGAPFSRVLRSHVLRNSMLPIVTILGMDIGLALGGAIFTESIYGLPGLGREVIKAYGRVDLPVITGVVVFASIAIIIFNLVVDIVYAFLDPRIKLS